MTAAMAMSGQGEWVKDDQHRRRQNADIGENVVARAFERARQVHVVAAVGPEQADAAEICDQRHRSEDQHDRPKRADGPRLS